MAQQLISLGTTANDGTGDTLRVAGAKINADIAVLYAAIPATDTGFANNGTAGSKIVVVNQFQGPMNGGTSYAGSDTVSIADIQAMANQLDALTAKFTALFQTLIQNKLPGVTV